jgi:hypothetical protein
MTSESERVVFRPDAISPEERLRVVDASCAIVVSADEQCIHTNTHTHNMIIHTA